MPTQDTRITAAQNFVAGGVAGVLSRSLTAPLDVIKIRTQVGLPETHAGLIHACKVTYQQDGLRSFWRGNFLACLRLFPFSAIQLAAFHKLKIVLADDFGRLNAGRAMIVGMGAGMVANVMTYPIEMVRTRLIVQPMDKTKSPYKGITNAFVQITKQEGGRALFRGLPVTLLASVPYSSLMLMAYELMDTMWTVPKEQKTPIHSFINGCIASGFAGAITFPFDVIRKKMQAWSKVLPANGGVDVTSYRAIDAINNTLSKYGMLGYWRGLLPYLIKIVPYHGIMFVTYEVCKRGQLYYNGYNSSPVSNTPRAGIDPNFELDEVEDLTKHPPIQ